MENSKHNLLTFIDFVDGGLIAFVTKNKRLCKQTRYPLRRSKTEVQTASVLYHYIKKDKKALRKCLKEGCDKELAKELRNIKFKKSEIWEEINDIKGYTVNNHCIVNHVSIDL